MWYHSISLHMHWLTYPALSSLLTQLRILITTILTSCNNRGHPLLAFRKNAGVKRFTCYLKNGHLLYTVYGSTCLWSFLLKSLYIALYFFPFSPLHSVLASLKHWSKQSVSTAIYLGICDTDEGASAGWHCVCMCETLFVWVSDWLCLTVRIKREQKTERSLLCHQDSSHPVKDVLMSFYLVPQ